MAYVGLGSRMRAAALDQTGFNTGNWTTAFTADVLGVNVPFFQIYHAIVEGVPAGTNAVVKIGIRSFSYTNPDQGSEWDPVQPPLLTPGQDVFFLWSTPATGEAPVTTIWLRYDTAVIEAAQKGYIA